MMKDEAAAKAVATEERVATVFPEVAA